jgi:hypothetical protein
MKETVEEMKKYGFSKSNVQDFVKQQKIKVIDGKYYIGVNPNTTYYFVNEVLCQSHQEEHLKIIYKNETPVLLLIAEKNSSVNYYN